MALPFAGVVETGEPDGGLDGAGREWHAAIVMAAAQSVVFRIPAVWFLPIDTGSYHS
jgi:hypothetical protein